jgi:hypothetical protein
LLYVQLQRSPVKYFCAQRISYRLCGEDDFDLGSDWSSDFFLGVEVKSSPGWFFEFSFRFCIFLALAGVVHFVWGRYYTYRSVKAIRSNLAGPFQKSRVLIALALAVVGLG